MPNSNESLKKGRHSKDKSLDLRIRIFENLLERWQANSQSVFKYKDIENNLRINRKTVRSVIQDVADISANIVIDSEGIRAGRNTYYHKHIQVARDAKKKMADKFVSEISQIEQNVTLACSPGTSVTYCVRCLIEKSMEKRQYHVIVTNNMGVLDMLAYSDIANLVFTGGEYLPAIHACVGNETVESFRKARCQAALIGVSGISDDGGLFVSHSSEIAVLKQIVQSTTNYIYIIADLEKLLHPDTWEFSTIPELYADKNKSNRKICLITAHDKPLEERQKGRLDKIIEALKKMGVKLIYADD